MTREKARIMEVPDIEELHASLHNTRSEIIASIFPIIQKSDANIFLNSLCLTLLQIATMHCDTLKEAKECVDVLCDSLKKNVNGWTPPPEK